MLFGSTSPYQYIIDDYCTWLACKLLFYRVLVDFRPNGILRNLHSPNGLMKVVNSDDLLSSFICQNPLLASKVRTLSHVRCDILHCSYRVVWSLESCVLVSWTYAKSYILVTYSVGSGAGVITLSYIIVSSSFSTASSIASGTLWDGLMTRVTLSSSVILYTTEVYELETTDSFQVEIFNEYKNLFNGALGEVPLNVSPP